MSLKTPHTLLTTPWYAMGSQVVPGGPPRINETATRGRAGLLNAISASTVAVLLLAPEMDVIPFVGPFVFWDMVTAASTGLTPLSPVGLLGTLITMKMEPVWKPYPPKRFAWTLGALMAVLCTTMRAYNQPNEYIAAVVGMCYVLTWLEAALGFCVGCWMYKLIFGYCDEAPAPGGKQD